jgi:hypothetical protein
MKRSLVVLFVAVTGAAMSSSPALAKSTCALTAKTPKVMNNGEIRSAGSTRCSRTIRRSLDISYMVVLTSGRKLDLGGQGFSGRFRAGVRNGWGNSATQPCEWITNKRHSRRYKDDLPVKYFVRIGLYRYDFGKRLKQKDSRAVPLATLCPDSPVVPGAPPRA